MPNKMLIDATHPEETRVVVLRGNRVEEFDFESANRKQLRGNIYLAKVTRVEPSLQAAFVDYGGNRHGFLAFSEIHPDYYQIPVADRQALIDEEERAARAADAEADHRAGRRAQRDRPAHRDRDEVRSEPVETAEADDCAMVALTEVTVPPSGDEPPPAEHEHGAVSHTESPEHHATDEAPHSEDAPHVEEPRPVEDAPHTVADAASEVTAEGAASDAPQAEGSNGHNIVEVNGNGATGEEEVIESVGGADALEEVPERNYRSRRQYKIQEVIKRRQVMLVQVVKEERGTKGAALTTYLSLAGRYSVLMPNTARGGGISRKITSAEDRRRLKEIAQDLEVPEGMGVILRTAGAARTQTEVKRDFEYLLRLWETVRDLTLNSTAPMLVYEEGSLVKRSIRDLYNKDIDEILVAGDEGYTDAKEFMRMLMPGHAKNVKAFRDSLPIFTRFGIESQLDAMFQPVVQLRSGGYIVINQTEALVAIDVNSGRATREHHIEDTALKTNMEAAEEIARQLRLRDLAGLIVIDYIDMDEKRNNRTVERRLKEALKHDRARIQVGHISHFGLLEMSRQRIRSSVLESSTEKCPHCGGTGHVRSVSSVALQLLRALEEMLLKGATHNVIVRTRTEIALYLLNHKRAHLRALEERFRIALVVNADATIAGQVSYMIEKGEQVHSVEQAKAIAAQPTNVAPIPEEDDEEELVEAEEDIETAEVEAAEDPGEAEDEAETVADAEQPPAARHEGNGRRRRRRGRRGEGRGQDNRNGSHESNGSQEGIASEPSPALAEHADGDAQEAEVAAENGTDAEARGDAERRRRRRGRRGGRRNRRDREGETPQASTEAEFEGGTPAAETGAHAEPQPEGDEPEPHVPAHDRAVPQPDHHAEAHSQHPEPAPQTPEASEPPRRRSTVREPAPMSVGSFEPAGSQVPASEPPQPVVISPTETTDAKPRRSGWWSRRVLGKD